MEDEKTDATHATNQLILSLRDKVMRAKAIRDIAGVPPSLPSQRLKEKIMGKPTAVARSETMVTPEEAQQLIEKISQAKDFIVQHGEDVSEVFHHPPGTTYRYQQDDIVYDSDSGATVGNNEPGFKVMVSHRTKDFDITIAFNFDDEFICDIELPNPEDPDKRLDVNYDSGDQPIEEMTKEEFEISQAYLSLLH